MRQKRTFQLLGIVVAILVMSVGYASISNLNFTITGNATAAPSAENFKVVFGKVGTADAPTFSVGAGTSTGVNVAFTTPSDRVATLDVTGLKRVGDSVVATFKVINESTDLDATLTDLNTTGTNNYFTVTAKSTDKVIKARQKTNIEVTVTLKKLPVTSNAVANISVNFSAIPTELANVNGGTGGGSDSGGNGNGNNTSGRTTIWEGNATTQEGMAVLGEENLFAYGNAGTPYRITVASDEYTGYVETVPILLGTEEGMTMYALFGVENGQAIGVISFEDAEAKVNNMGENSTFVLGIAAEGMCGVMFQNVTTGEYATSEYTITKIERGEAEISIEKYFLGPHGTGKHFQELLINENANNDISFINDPIYMPEASILIEYITFEGTDLIVRYNGWKLYKVVFNDETGYTESITLYETEKIQGREGKTVKYDSNNDGTKEDWIILTDRNGLVEIVSAQPMGSLTLGKGDTTVSVTTDLDGDGTVGNNVDIAIASYNNAITTINNYCKSLVTATDNEGVRSVGASIEQDTSGDYSSENFNRWFKNSSTVKVKAGDEYYKTDFDRMQVLWIADTNEEYWLASRNVCESSSIVDFYVRRVFTDGNLDYYNLWYVSSDGSVYYYDPSYAVRPVVINPSGI